MTIHSRFFFTFLLFSILGILCSVSWSYSTETKEVKDPDDIPFLDDEKEQELDEFHDNFGSWLEEKAVWFDSFFDEDNYIEETNETNAKASLSIGYSRKDDIEFSPRFRLRLRLPHLEDKARLIISASDDNGLSDDSTSLIGGVRDNNDRDDLTAGIQYFLRQSVNDHLSLSGGASFDYLYAGVRARYSLDYGEWRNRFTNNLRYYTDDGWENKASIEMDHPLKENLMFRGILRADWYEDQNGLDHSIHSRVYQFLDVHHSLRYDVGFYFKTRSNYYMEDARFQVTHRQRFGRDWLALEISPFLTFPAENDREVNPGLFFKFEAEFGYSPEGRGFNLNLINR